MFVLVVSSHLASGQNTAGAEQVTSSAEAGAGRGDLRIGSGDLLEISLYGGSDFNQVARVSESGDIVLPLIGQVHVDGLTSQQAQALIAAQLVEGQYYKHPQIVVFIREYATQGVSVLGEVNKPGVYPRLGDRRLFDMISAAGGYSPRAGTTVTITHRGDPDNPQTVQISNDPIRSQFSNVEIQPGDTIFVSQAAIVYVVGDVSKPSGFAMQNNENMTVLQAIAMAGGAHNTAALNNARLIRRGSQGIEEIPMPLKKILQAKAADPMLQPGDILFVPASAGKSVAKRSVEAILQAATGVTIYHSW
jgi:polysaccharide export outer membrane protein